MNLNTLDLNLLRTLNVLLTERSVSKTARVLNLSQPAVSNALARLRQEFGDPLFVRTPSGMQPTPRAVRLKSPISQALGKIDEAVRADAGFNPAAESIQFNIASTDFDVAVVGTQLARRFAETAPGVRLNISQLHISTPSEDLGSGKIDLAISFRFDERGGLISRTIAEDEFVCMLRKDHPAAKKKLTLERYVALKHLQVAPWGKPGGIVDTKLAELGHTRDVVTRVPSFMTAPFIILETNYVVTLPGRAAAIAARHLPVVLLPLPLDIPRFPIAIAWHERTHHDPANRWLRQQVVEVASKPLH